MIKRHYLIFSLFSFLLLSLAFGEDSKEETVISREDLVGHYIGSNEDQMVWIELGQFIYKFFRFEDFAQSSPTIRVRWGTGTLMVKLLNLMIQNMF